MPSYTYDVPIEFDLYQFPTLRNRGNVYATLTFSIERVSLPIFFELKVLTETTFLVNFEGFSEGEEVLKRLFDHLPNFFASFREESEK